MYTYEHHPISNQKNCTQSDENMGIIWVLCVPEFPKQSEVNDSINNSEFEHDDVELEEDIHHLLKMFHDGQREMYYEKY